MGYPQIDTFTNIKNIYSGRSLQSLAPFLQSDLNLNHAQIGILTSTFFMGVLFLFIPMGWPVDRIGVYWMMSLGQLIVRLFFHSISGSSRK